MGSHQIAESAHTTMHDAKAAAAEPQDPTPPLEESEPLSATLKQRHLTMLGLGGVIGAGLFVGSGAGISVAGPGIVVSYLIAGTLAMLVMRMLGEMSAAMPASGSFSVHAERAMTRPNSWPASSKPSLIRRGYACCP